MGARGKNGYRRQVIRELDLLWRGTLKRYTLKVI